jgi:hypothetical protein
VLDTIMRAILPRPVPDTRIEVLVLNDGTSATGGPDPAQPATNARKMVSDETVVAALSPQTNGAGKASAPIRSQGGLATITPTATIPTAIKGSGDGLAGSALLTPSKHGRCFMPGARRGPYNPRGVDRR